MYYILKDNKIVLYDENRTRLENTIKFMPQHAESEIQETERLIVDFEFADTPEWQEQQAEKERERIGNLQITKRVFALSLQELGVTYSQLKELIATNEQAQLEWDLCVELQRKNPLIDVMAVQLGIMPAMIDYIFQKANGEDVILPDIGQ